MSGKPWTAERKAAFSKQQKARWRDPKLRKAAAERGRKTMADPKKRAAKSELMKCLNRRMNANPELKKKLIAGQKRVRRRKGYREMRALAMGRLMARPENREKARAHACAINRDPKIRAKQWAGRRRKQQLAAAPQAPPAPRMVRDVDAIFLRLLANEARERSAGMTALPRLELADHDSPFDEAVILIEGREEETITIACEGARELALRLVAIVNHHEQVVQTLQLVSEVLRKFGAVSAAVEIDKLKITTGDAA